MVLLMVEHFKMNFSMLYKKVRFLFIEYSEENQEMLLYYYSILHMT